MTLKTYKKLRTKSLNDHPKMLAKARNLYNEWVRLYHSNSDGYCKCVTCGKIMYYKGGDCQAGHFWHTLDFVSDNQHAQCKRCNTHLHGNLIEYAIFMIKKYGEQRVQELKLMKNLGHKYSCEELRIMCKAYRQAISKQKKKRGIT